MFAKQGAPPFSVRCHQCSLMSHTSTCQLLAIYGLVLTLVCVAPQKLRRRNTESVVEMNDIMALLESEFNMTVGAGRPRS